MARKVLKLLTTAFLPIVHTERVGSLNLSPAFAAHALRLGKPKLRSNEGGPGLRFWLGKPK
jgi:hypothetical protein